MAALRKLRSFPLLALLALAMWLLAACAVPATPAEAPAEEAAAPASAAPSDLPAEPGRGTDGTASLLYWQAVSIMNPLISTGTKDQHAASLVLEPLFRYGPEGDLLPVLAAEIPTVENGGISEDLTTITWKLKPDVLWSDGTPLTPDDFIFTWQYCIDEATGCNSANLFEGVSNMEAVDPTTLKITFDAPRPFPYSPFGGYLIPVLQKAQFENCAGEAAQSCADQNSYPIGTGPYTVKDFKANDVVVYAANENYREEGKPHFAEIVLKGGGDAASAARAVLETGEADYAWNLQVEPQILSDMEAAGLGTVENAFAGFVERLVVNLTNPDPALGDLRSEWTADNPNPHPFLTDPAVVAALSMAIDRNIIAEQLYGFAGKPTCNALAGPPAFVSTANDACLTQDIEGANAMLEEAGWVDSNGDGVREKDGVELRILYQTTVNPVREKTQALIKQWWEEIGVATELKNVDAAVFFGGDPASPDTIGKFYADIQMYTNGNDSIDPQQYLSGWLCSEIATRENNWLGNNDSRYCSEAYDSLYETFAATADPAQRAELAKELNDMLVQDGVLIPLIYRGNVSGHSNSLGGVIMNGWDTEEWNIQDWFRVRE